MAENTNYRKYFSLGKRIGISIPLADGRFFNEWGTIWAYEEDDLLEFQLSRDLLPADVNVEVGTILELKTEIGTTRYSSRGIIVDSNGPSRYFIRIIGEVILDEVREFYRLDVFLPVTYSRIDCASVDEARQTWQERRERRALERLGHGEETELQRLHEVPPLAANISGGGVRIRIPDELKIDDMVDLQLFVPSSQKTKETVVDIIGQVVYVHGTGSPESHNQMFSTAIRFLHIDERDRDQVIKFISWEQLQRIRQLRERYYKDVEPEQPSAPQRMLFRKLVGGLILLALTGLFADFVLRYYEHHEKSEIHKIFERGIRDYMNKHKPVYF